MSSALSISFSNRTQTYSFQTILGSSFNSIFLVELGNSQAIEKHFHNPLLSNSNGFGISRPIGFCKDKVGWQSWIWDAEVTQHQNFSDAASDSGWKEKLKKPVKDARPQTEVVLLRHLLFNR